MPKPPPFSEIGPHIFHCGFDEFQKWYLKVVEARGHTDKHYDDWFNHCECINCRSDFPEECHIAAAYGHYLGWFAGRNNT
jgi:hypothetical protein